MDYKVEEIDITTKLTKLGLTVPDSVAFFPENFENANVANDFIFTDSMLDLNKIFRQEKNISINALGNDTEKYRSRKNADIYLPAMFFALTAITENPTIVSISLNVLSSYVYDLFKGTSGQKTAHIDLYVETKEKGKVKKISYKGSADGLKDLEKVIKAMK
jgi:hypothetical protein